MDIQKEIDRIKTKLSYSEDTDTKYMTESVRELRHCVMYVHSAIESALDVRIGQYLLKDIKTTKDETHAFHWILHTLTDEVDFYKKVKVLQSWNFIPDLHSQLMAVNNYRIKFSHPSSYQDELRSYRDEKEELKILLILEKAFDSLNSLILSEHPEWQTPTSATS